MKILNRTPSTIVEYSFNAQAFSLSENDYTYGSGFGYRITSDQSSPLVTVNFEIKYTSGETETNVTFLPNNVVHYESIYDEASAEVIISFKTTFAFQFESEGFEADLMTIKELLSDHYNFALGFMKNYLPKSVLKLETDTRKRDKIEDQAHLLIENLRSNHVYNF